MGWIIAILLVLALLPSLVIAFAAGWGLGRASGLRHGEEKLNRYIAKQSNNRR